ncbi:hypothetical protein QE152_g38968 [Popillia japonica]|uniref:Holliday junction resolvase n=1 Tax=Popillia japonica TaxID=7064 RepID=A0AAW1HVI1_POPJA
MGKGKINSRAKGAKGERELSSKLRDYGYEARRGQQFSGANGDADVVGLPGIHIECKRVERLNIYDAIWKNVITKARNKPCLAPVSAGEKGEMIAQICNRRNTQQFKRLHKCLPDKSIQGKQNETRQSGSV